MSRRQGGDVRRGCNLQIGFFAVRHKTRQVKKVSVESLTLAVEVFNRPNTTARTAGVLLPLQHALEMLFKAVIFEKRGTLRDKGEKHSFKFSKCLGILRSELRVLDERDALIAEMVDAHRDAVQHYGSIVRHEQLYVDAMGALTVFDDLHERVFSSRLADLDEFRDLPLALTSTPPKDFHTLVSRDFLAIRDLLGPKRRARAEAAELLRPHVLTERAATNPQQVEQPTERELDRMLNEIKAGRSWQKLLPGLSKLTLDQDRDVSFGLHLITKSKAPADAIPAKLVKEADPEAGDAIAVERRYLERDYPFIQKTLIENVEGVNQEQVRAIIYLLGIKEDTKMYAEGKLGRMPYALYSHAALRAIRHAVAEGRVEEAVQAYKKRPTYRPRGRR